MRIFLEKGEISKPVKNLYKNIIYLYLYLFLFLLLLESGTEDYEGPLKNKC